MLFWLIGLAVPCFKAPWFYELLSKCLNWVRCSLPGFDEYLITSQNNPKKLIFARVTFCGINFRKDYFCELWANLLKKSAKGSRWIFTSNKNTVRHPPNAGQFFLHFRYCNNLIILIIMRKKVKLFKDWFFKILNNSSFVMINSKSLTLIAINSEKLICTKFNSVVNYQFSNSRPQL